MKFKELIKENKDPIIPQDSEQVVKLKGHEQFAYNDFMLKLAKTLADMFLTWQASMAWDPETNGKKTLVRRNIGKQFSYYDYTIYFNNSKDVDLTISLQMNTDSESKTAWYFEFMELSAEQDEIEFYDEFETEFGSQFENNVFNFEKIKDEFIKKTREAMDKMLDIEPAFIKWIKNPTKAQQEKVLKKDPRVIQWIVNLDPELREKYKYMTSMRRSGILSLK